VTDEQYPRSAGDDAEDPQALAEVERLLAGLDFLRPDESDTPAESMPDWAWARISSALQAEAASVSPASHPSRSRLMRWGGGLVAASLAVVAVGIAVNVSQGSGGGAVVADAVPSAETEARALSLSGDAAAEESAGAPAPGAAAEGALAPPRQFNFAGMVPPALNLMGTRTDYSAKDMQGQVTEVLEETGVAPMASMPSPQPTMDVPDAVPAVGFLASPRGLRDCVTKLTHKGTSTALMIDTSTYEGRPASIVVAPDYDMPDSQAPDLSMIEVWVVDPDCQVTWQMRFRLGR
jgi:hypothetical protein